MPQHTKYHLSEHRADALLQPLDLQLDLLEARVRHYLDRLHMTGRGSRGDRSGVQGGTGRARRGDAAISGAGGGAAAARAGREVMSAEGTHKRVLITGAAGRIGSSLAEQLKDRYALRLHYNRTVPEQKPVDDYVVANIADYDAIAPAMEGIDAVVHMAGNPSTRGTWAEVLDANIVGTYNVYESARLAGVKKIILTSTNHVMGMYDRDRAWPIYADQPVRPDSLYGVSKAFGENLGRHYVDQYGLSVICLRIGWFLQQPKDDIGRFMWLSARDCAQIVWRAIESPLDYGVFYAISGNSGRHWDITDTIERLGYRPQDDAERFFERAE